MGGLNMSEAIVITSGKGGVGKTTATANIGTGLARMQKKVVLVDTDIGTAQFRCCDGAGKQNRL